MLKSAPHCSKNVFCVSLVMVDARAEAFQLTAFNAGVLPPALQPHAQSNMEHFTSAARTQHESRA